MKRKIAVFTNGWSDDYLEFALEGIRKRAAEDNIDVFIFLDYTSYDKSKEELTGELNILNLPELKNFDGVLLLGNTLTNAGEINILRDKLLEAKVPALCLEYSLDGINCIRTENINGMKELAEHMITEHGVKDIFWVSGPADNEESQQRYKALVDTMAKHGLTADPEAVFDGCWSYAIVEEKMPDIIKNMPKLPDAFMCANDNMALAVCSVLEKMGIAVPRDVRVTGFDNLMSGNHYSPMITSVDRGWNERSYQAADSLIALINGAPDFGEKVYDSTFDRGESCGCDMGQEALKIQREARQRAFLMPVERTIFDWHLIDIDKSVAGVSDYDALHRAFSDLWSSNHSYESDNFFICLDDAFVKSMYSDVSCLTEGYSDEIDVIYGMMNGADVPQHTIPVKDIVPCYDPDSPETATYLIIPLHMDEECFGYYVSKDHIKSIKDFYINSLTRHISSALARVRQNIHIENLNRLLADISVRDELTGLYNRMGYERIVIPFLDDLRRTKQNAVIMVADINSMKGINDRHGHLMGDSAIKIAASVIKSVVPKNWKAVRYGGDEYVIIGDYGSSVDMESIKQKIIDKAYRISEDLDLPFRLSVSVGYVIIDPSNDLGNEEYFRKADEAMYEMKQKTHISERRD